MAAMLSALSASLALPPRKVTGTVRGWANTRIIMRMEGERKLKKEQ
jgi:hypothetical protein